MIRLLYPILIVFAAVLLGCQDVQPRTAHSELTEANKRKMELLDAVDRRYENPDAHYQLGELYFDEGQYEKAAFHFNVAIGFDPVHYKAMASRVKALNYAKNTTQSRSDAQTYLEQARTSSQASILLGRAFQAEKLPEYALSAFKQAVRIAPTSPETNKQLAYYYLSRDNRKLAERYFSISFEMDPYQGDVAAELGRLGIIVESPESQAEQPETEPAGQVQVQTEGA